MMIHAKASAPPCFSFVFQSPHRLSSNFPPEAASRCTRHPSSHHQDNNSPTTRRIFLSSSCWQCSGMEVSVAPQNGWSESEILEPSRIFFSAAREQQTSQPHTIIVVCTSLLPALCRLGLARTAAALLQPSLTCRSNNGGQDEGTKKEDRLSFVLLSGLSGIGVPLVFTRNNNSRTFRSPSVSTVSALPNAPQGEKVENDYVKCVRRTFGSGVDRIFSEERERKAGSEVVKRPKTKGTRGDIDIDDGHPKSEHHWSGW